MTARDFARQTPGELRDMIDGAVRHRAFGRQIVIEHAWLTAMWGKDQRPALEKLLGHEPLPIDPRADFADAQDEAPEMSERAAANRAWLAEATAEVEARKRRAGAPTEGES